MRALKNLNKPTVIFLFLSIIGCGASENSFDQLGSNTATEIPSGSVIISSNNNGTTGPGLITVWKPDGEFDRVIYDYTKVTTGYASGLAFVSPSKIFAITDTGGGASNDFLDLFDYFTPFANPINLFSNLASGGATTYMRSMALVTNSSLNQHYVFVAEAGNNRVTRLSSPISDSSSGLNFVRDFNFANNGTCSLTTAYGVAEIPTSGNIAVVSSAASGRLNIFDQAGTCIGSTALTNFPTQVAFHALSGKLLVTNATNSSITAHSISNGALSPATAIYTSAGILSTPRAIATDAEGNIYVGSDGLDQVVKLYWNGVAASASYIGTFISPSTFTQNISSIVVVP